MTVTTRAEHPALARAWPRLAASLPRIPLAELPTPVAPLAHFGEALGAADLWVKRDDLSARRYGGNKVRKLEFLLGDALERGCDAVLTFGATGSNHALATSIFARELGLTCYAVLTPQPDTPWLARTLLCHEHLGTRLVPVTGYQETLDAKARVLAAHPGGAERVAVIPWGGSSWQGTAGFVAAAAELVQQTTDAGVTMPDVIYIACGTMGSAAGLSLGLRTLGATTRVVATRVTPMAVAAEQLFERLFSETAAELHARDPGFPELDQPFANCTLVHDHFGQAYAVPTPEAGAAVALLEKTEGLKLETTYTGKALANLAADARAGKLAGRRVLFWNTYNSRALPAGDS